MKITATEEYGLRILLRIAQVGNKGMSIPQLSAAEGLSEPYIGKLARLLRLSGFVQSTRGHKGGYVLARPADAIVISEVIRALDGSLYDDGFCADHTATGQLCTHSVGCAVKSLWQLVQSRVDSVLDGITLHDLTAGHRTLNPEVIKIADTSDR